MSDTGFFGGFAQGFGATAGRRQEAQRLRDALALDQQEFGLRQQQFEENKSQFDQSIELERQQFEALQEHQAYSRDLQTRQHNLQMRQEDLNLAKYLVEQVLGPEKPPALRKAMLNYLAVSQGIDTKSPTYKAALDMIAAMPEEDLSGVRQMIGKWLPDVEPGGVKELFNLLMKDPSAGMRLLAGPESLTSDEPTENVVGPDGRPVIVPRSQSIGREPAFAPSAASKTPEQITQEQVAQALTKQDMDIVAPMRNFSINEYRGMKAAIDTFEATLDEGMFQPGSFSGIRTAMGQWAEFLGMDPVALGLDKLGVGDPASAELMNSITEQLALRMGEDLSRMTNLSITFVRNSVPQLLRTEKGNRLIIEMFRRGVEAEHSKAQIIENYLSTYGTLRPPDRPSVFQQLTIYDEMNPPIDEDFRSQLRAAADEGGTVDILGAAENILRGVAGSGDRTNTLRLGNDLQLPVVGSMDGLQLVNPSDELSLKSDNVPVLWSAEDIEKIAPGSEYIWGPSGTGAVYAPASASKEDIIKRMVEQGYTEQEANSLLGHLD